MKKFIFTTLLVVLACGVYAQGENQNHKNDGLARWSIGVKGGGDLYRVTPFVSFDAQKGETRMDQRLNAISWNGGLFLEYNPNPVFGIGISGSYNNYDRMIRVDGEEVNGETKHFGNTIDGVLYNSINISNLVSPQRTGGWKKVSFYVGTGIGGAAYTYQYSPATSAPPADREFGDYADRKFSLILMANAGLDFRLSKCWSFLIEGEYRYYNMTNMGGSEIVTDASSYSAAANDAFFANAGFRWKINGKKKEHVRNMTYDDYYKKQESRDQTVYDRLAALEKENAAIRDENAAMKQNINAIKSDTDGMKGDIKEIKDALKNMQHKEVVQKVTATAENIEFKTGSAILTEESKYLLDNVAEMLKSITWNRMDIAGHTDNVGNADKNKKLSQNRADAVKDYLAGKGLDVNKMESVGYGPEKPIASNNTEAGRQKNRRVEFAIK